MKDDDVHFSAREFAWFNSQVVQGLSEVAIVVQLLQVNVVGLLDDAVAVKAVVILCDLVSILTRGWHFDGT